MSLRNVASGAPPGRRPAQHLRRARLRRRRLHPGRARRVPGRPRARASSAKAVATEPRAEVEAPKMSDLSTRTTATSCSRRSSPRRATGCSTRTSTRSSSHPDANKTEIKIAVEQVFGVKVTGVNTLNRQGKRKRTRSGFGKREDTKRAIVSRRRRRPHRHLRRSGLLTGRRDRRGLRTHGYPQVQADHPGPSWLERRRLRRGHPLRRRRSRWSARCPRRAAATTHGRITTRHQGGGHKRAYRVIDFRRHDKDGVPAKVAHIEYDPNRTARIALLHYADGEKRYIIAPNRLKQGDRVENGPSADIKPGNNLPLRNIPVGTVDPRHRAAARWRREDRPLGRCQRPARRQGRPATPSCGCPPARSATSTCAAAPRSARSATPSSPTSTGARPAACAGRASARPSAVSP